MKNFIKKFVKWIIAGIGIGIGLFMVLVSILLWDKKDKQDSSDDITAVFSNDIDNDKQDNSEPLSQQLSQQSMEDNQDVPIGYRLTEEGGLMLDAPIMGMEWESVEDENTTTDPRLYEPFTLIECLTENDERLQLDVVNSDIGYQLQFYFANANNDLQLEAKSFTEEAHFAFTLNSTIIMMRDPMHYYYFSYDDDGDTSLLILDTLKGRQINYYECVDNSDSDRRPTLFQQMIPKHFKFKPMTDELEEILNERFENR